MDPASPPSSVVLDWAGERDLLATGAPATSWFGGMFLGGVAVSAEGEFTTPMLVARTMPAEPRFASRILIASDGLAGSDELVELGGRVAHAQGASVVLLHASGFESKARRRRVEEQACRLQLDVDDPSQVRLESGSARTMIVETASAVGASLIVIGSRRLRGLRVIGSVSRRVFTKAIARCCSYHRSVDQRHRSVSAGGVRTTDRVQCGVRWTESLMSYVPTIEKASCIAQGDCVERAPELDDCARSSVPGATTTSWPPREAAQSRRGQRDRLGVGPADLSVIDLPSRRRRAQP